MKTRSLKSRLLLRSFGKPSISTVLGLIAIFSAFVITSGFVRSNLILGSFGIQAQYWLSFDDYLRTGSGVVQFFLVPMVAAWVLGFAVPLFERGGTRTGSDKYRHAARIFIAGSAVTLAISTFAFLYSLIRLANWSSSQPLDYYSALYICSFVAIFGLASTAVYSIASVVRIAITPIRIGLLLFILTIILTTAEAMAYVSRIRGGTESLSTSETYYFENGDAFATPNWRLLFQAERAMFFVNAVGGAVEIRPAATLQRSLVRSMRSSDTVE